LTFTFIALFVQRFDRVAVEHRHCLLRQDRTGVDFFSHEVHGRARDLHTELQRVPYRVPALERGQQRRVRVHRVSPVRVDERLRQDGAEPRDRDELHVLTLQRVHDVVGVGDAVELRREIGALDELGGDPGGAGDLECAARPVGDDRDHGQAAFEHGIEDRATTRSEDSYPHTEPP
jgi:hypothetical protein